MPSAVCNKQEGKLCMSIELRHSVAHQMLDISKLLVGNSAQLSMAAQGLLAYPNQLLQAALSGAGSPAASTGLLLHAWPPAPVPLAPCVILQARPRCHTAALKQALPVEGDGRNSSRVMAGTQAGDGGNLSKVLAAISPCFISFGPANMQLLVAHSMQQSHSVAV